MPRGRSLSVREIGQIEAYRDAGLSNRQIAQKIGRSPRVVNNFLKDPMSYGTAKRAGRHPKLDARDKRRVIRRASNSLVSSSAIQRELDLPVTPRTVRNVLKASPHIVRGRMRRAPMLTEMHKLRRIDFARTNFNRDWSKEKLRFATRNFGGGGLMVWASFNAESKLNFAFLSNKVDSEEYQRTLAECLVPFLDEHNGDDLVFQQDGAPAHRSISTRNWLAGAEIAVLEWSANSPDLNPMENVWGILVRRLYAENKSYNNLAELQQAIEAEWESLEPHILQNLVLSMNRRCEQVIGREGGPTDY